MKKPLIIHRDKFLVMGAVARRSSGNEGPEAVVSIWKQFEMHHEEIRVHSLDSKYYGVSFSTAPDGSFDYLAGMAVARMDPLPAGVQVREVPAAVYAVFACDVPSIGQTYGYIFGEWRSASGCEVDPAKCAFEEYPSAAEPNAAVLIHIPIREEHMEPTLEQPEKGSDGSQHIR